jgi:hypothetical protein
MGTPRIDRVPDVKETIENTSQVDAIKTVISLMAEQEDTVIN